MIDKKRTKIAFIALAFSFLIAGADLAAAQKKGGYYGGKQERKEYRKEAKEARKEYRRDVREVRREYREDRRENRRYNQTYRRTPNGRARGYYTVRPYRGANRGFYRGRLPRKRY